MKKQTVISFLQNFYQENFKLWQAGQASQLRPLYEKACWQLAQLAPVEYILDPCLTPEKLTGLTGVIVAANHLPFPNLFGIKDPELLRKMGINPPNLLWETLHPVILRHYPLVNFLTEHSFDTHVVANLETPPLDKFSAGWGAIQIPWQGRGRLAFIIQQVQALPAHKKQAVIFFPEGSDSWGDPLKEQYHLLPFRSGFVLAAQKLNWPILPISLALKSKPLRYCAYLHPLIEPVQRRLNRPGILSRSIRRRIKKGLGVCKS